MVEESRDLRDKAFLTILILVGAAATASGLVQILYEPSPSPAALFDTALGLAVLLVTALFLAPYVFPKTFGIPVETAEVVSRPYLPYAIGARAASPAAMRSPSSEPMALSSRPPEATGTGIPGGATIPRGTPQSPQEPVVLPRKPMPDSSITEGRFRVPRMPESPPPPDYLAPAPEEDEQGTTPIPREVDQALEDLERMARRLSSPLPNDGASHSVAGGTPRGAPSPARQVPSVTMGPELSRSGAPERVPVPSNTSARPGERPEGSVPSMAPPETFREDDEESADLALLERELTRVRGIIRGSRQAGQVPDPLARQLLGEEPETNPIPETGARAQMARTSTGHPPVPVSGTKDRDGEKVLDPELEGIMEEVEASVRQALRRTTPSNSPDGKA